MRRAIIPAEGLAQYDAMVRDLEAFKREHPPAKYKIHIDTTAFMGDLRKRGDEAKSQIEERYRKAQADKEYANRVIEERKQQAKENAARRNAEIEEQRRKIAERKAAEEEARKTKTLDRRVMGDSDVICATPSCPTATGTAPPPTPSPISTSSDSPPKSSATRTWGAEGKAARGGQGGLSAETLFSAAGTANNDGMSFGAADLFQGAGIDLVGAGLGGTGSRAMRRAGAAAAGLGLATAGGLLSAYQALSQGKIGEPVFDTFRDQMIMTVGSFGLQTGMSSALSALTKMRIGTVGDLACPSSRAPSRR
eukprot:tig00000451_g984.t1